MEVSTCDLKKKLEELDNILHVFPEKYPSGKSSIVGLLLKSHITEVLAKCNNPAVKMHQDF